MYEENKPSTLINDVQEWLNFFCAILVRSAMPNNNMLYLFNRYSNEGNLNNNNGKLNIIIIIINNK